MNKKIPEQTSSQFFDPSQRSYVHPDTGRLHVETVNVEDSKTQQQFKDECDINNIMKKYSDTGVFTHLTSKSGAYGDFTEIPDYQGSLDTVLRAQDAFSSLPADVRYRFGNDPGSLISFLADDKNYEEALKLGLVEKRQNKEPQPLNNNDSNDDAQAKATSKKGVKPTSSSTDPKDT